jgi:hypothetical protein
MSVTTTNNNFSFDHSVSVLIKAYLNGNLQKGNCSACAVGNLIADALHLELEYVLIPNNRQALRALVNDTYVIQWVGTNASWLGVLLGVDRTERGISAKDQLASTGYSREQLRLIEWTFENPGGLIRGQLPHAELVYRGLLAVVDVLAEIHGIDLTTSKRASTPFTQEYTRLTELVAQ